MRAEINTPRAEVVAGSRPMQVVLAYDHPAVAKAARALIESYLGKFAPECEVHRDEWSFAELEHPKCASEALELAAPCDLFIVATAGWEPLPAAFIEWLNKWLETREAMETALLLCVAAGSSAHPSLNLGFEAMAHSRGLTFLATSIRLPEELMPHGFSPKSLLAKLVQIKNESLPDFSGLNE